MTGVGTTMVLGAGCWASVATSVETALERGPIPGAVLGVDGPSGRWVQAVGRDVPATSILRLSSLTKPVVAAATLLLERDGLLALGDPIERWLPEMAAPCVLKHRSAAIEDTVAVEHRITVEDLLTMRLGTGFAFEVPDCSVAAAAEQAQLGWGPPVPSGVPHSPDEWVGLLAELPLIEQPGRWWRYGTAFSLLGVLLARASGQTLPSLLQERVTGPLRLHDTGFHVDQEASERLVPCLVWSGEGDAGVLDPAEGSAWSTPPVFPDGAGGLVGTADDVLTFGRALLDAGRGGQGSATGSVLPADVVQAMSTEQVPLAQRTGGGNAHMFLDPDTWGYGVGIRVGEERPSRYGWAGGLGTFWYSYPEHDIAAVVMTQCVPPPTYVIDTFWAELERHLGDGGC